MKGKISLILLAWLLMQTTTFAYIRFAPEVGLNLAFLNEQTKSGGLSHTRVSDLSPGYRVGLLIDIPLGSNVYLQPSVTYNWNNIKFTKELDFTTYGINGAAETERYRLHNIQVPFLITYKSGFENMERFFCGIGPYVSINIGGNYRLRYPVVDSGGRYSFKKEASEVQIGEKGNNNQFSALDYGLMAQIGYESSVRIYFKGVFSYGLANIAPQGSDFAFKRNWGIGFTLGVLLGRDDW